MYQLNDASEITPLDMCYRFNGALICHVKRPRYFEQQYEYRCGLHAINNLFQNQSLVSGIPIFTYTEILDFCRIFIKDNNVCNPKGYLSTYTILNFINDLSGQFTARLGEGDFRKYLEFMRLRSHLVLGAIVLYQAYGCENHYVSLIYEKPYFLVIDSGSDGHAHAFDTLEEVIKFFHTFKYIIMVGLN